VLQFLNKFGPVDRQVQLSPRAAEMLQSYNWPGNVRELQNVVQRALVLCNGDTITENELMFDEVDAVPMTAAVAAPTASHLMGHDTLHGMGLSQPMVPAMPAMPGVSHFSPAAMKFPTMAQPTGLQDLSSAVKSSEYQAIMAAIQTTRNRNEAAAKLGISPRSLRYKMAQFRERGMPVMAAA